MSSIVETTKEYLNGIGEGLSDSEKEAIKNFGEWLAKGFCTHGHNGLCPICDAMQTPPINRKPCCSCGDDPCTCPF